MSESLRESIEDILRDDPCGQKPSWENANRIVDEVVATALAEAEARGRRQGLPDLTDMQVDMLSVQLATALLQTAPMEPGRIDPLRRVRPMVRDLHETIRSLATTSAETQKPEETA